MPEARPGTTREATRNALLIGETVDSLRLRDAIQAVRALLVPKVHQVALIDPPASHRAGPHFLNVMQYTDLPEAAALLAPRRLNFIAHEPEAYGAARKIFGLYGHPEHVFVSFRFEGLLAGKYHHAFASAEPHLPRIRRHATSLRALAAGYIRC